MRFVLLLLLASACASPQPIYTPISVDVPIAIPCKIKSILRPEWPTNRLTALTGLDTDVKAMTSELYLRRGYEAKLEAVIKSCQ